MARHEATTSRRRPGLAMRTGGGLGNGDVRTWGRPKSDPMRVVASSNSNGRCRLGHQCTVRFEMEKTSRVLGKTPISEHFHVASSNEEKVTCPPLLQSIQWRMRLMMQGGLGSFSHVFSCLLPSSFLPHPSSSFFFQKMEERLTRRVQS